MGVITAPIERCAVALNMNAPRSMGPGDHSLYRGRGYVWGAGQYLCGKETMECGAAECGPN